jgi:hypothetical protein
MHDLDWAHLREAEIAAERESAFWAEAEARAAEQADATALLAASGALGIPGGGASGPALAATAGLLAQWQPQGGAARPAAPSATGPFNTTRVEGLRAPTGKMAAARAHAVFGDAAAADA